MGKYWSKNNSSFSGSSHGFGSDNSTRIVAVLFLFVLALYMALPVWVQPIQFVWSRASQSRTAVESSVHSALVTQLAIGECSIIAIPPQIEYDVIITECNKGDDHVISGQRVYIPYGGNIFWFGNIVSVQGSSVIVRIVSDPNNSQKRVTIAGVVEQVPVIPIGGGTFVAELPNSVSVAVNSLVTDSLSGEPIAYVSGTVAENATLMQRVYMRIPVSFERMNIIQLHK